MAQPDPVRLAVIVGFVGASLFAGYGGYRAIMGARTQAPAAPVPTAASNGSAVLTASAPITRGEVIAAPKLRAISVEGTVPDGSFATPEPLVGRVATTDILPGQIMLPAMVSDDPAAGGLAALIPPGKRAIAIPIAEDVAVSNMVRAGDLVDVLVVLRSGVLPHAGIGAASPGGVVARPLEGGAAASPADPGDESETRLLLQAVPVLTVGDHLGGLRGPQPGEGGTLTPPPQRQEPSRTMTLALSPEETERLALGRTLGSLELTLRNPHDTDQEVRPPITLQELRGAKTGPMAAAHARRPIELIVGNEHRTIYSLDAALPEAAPEPTRRTGARAP
jgi:pilus assembly protein CpaB